MRYRLKKRTLTVIVCCLVVILIPAGLLVRLAERQLHMGHVLDWRLGEAQVRQSVLGNALDLDRLERNNWLSYSGFEPFFYRTTLRVDSGGTQSVLVDWPLTSGQSGAEALSAELYKGATARIQTLSDGVWSLKKETVVDQCRPNQISEFHPYTLPPDTPPSTEWLCFCGEEPSLVVGGTAGTVAYQDSKGDWQIAREERGSEIDFSHAASNEQSTLLLGSNQRLYWFKEGKLTEHPSVFKHRISWLFPGQTKRNESCFVGVCQDGWLYWIHEDQVTPQPPAMETAIKDCWASNAYLYCLSGEGMVTQQPLRTATLEQKEAVIKKLPVGADWNRIWGGGGALLAADSDGGDLSILTEAEAAEFKRISPPTSEASSSPWTSALVFSSKDFCLINDKGQVYRTLDGGESWDTPPLMQSSLQDPFTLGNLRRIWRSPKGLLLGSAKQAKLGYATLGTEIVFADSLVEGEFSGGDQVILEQSRVEPLAPTEEENTQESALDWYISDPQRVTLVQAESAPGGGQGCLQINGAGREDQREEKLLADSTALKGLYGGESLTRLSDLENDVHLGELFLFQPFSTDRLQKLQPFQALRFEFWAKQQGDPQTQLTLRLLGGTYPVESVKKGFSSEWNLYSAVLILPSFIPQQIIPGLCLSVETRGTLWIDRVRLVSEELDNQEICQMQRVTELMPSAVRLEAAAIGRSYLPPEYWLQPERTAHAIQVDGRLETREIGGLHQTLTALSRQKVMPWFVVYPSISETEFRHWIQYLFGRTNTEYGAIRLNQGMGSRWSDVFPSFYLEFCEETPGELGNDLNRQQWVNRMIDCLSQQPEYKQIRNQIVLIDGSDYTEEAFLSDADAHAQESLPLSPIYSRQNRLQWQDRRSQSLPRDPLKTLTGRSEFIKKADCSQLRASDWVCYMLEGLGQDVLMTAVLPEINPSSGDLKEKMPDLLSEIGRQLSGMNPVRMIPLNSVTEEAEGAAGQVLVYAYGHRNQRIIFYLNCGERSQLVRIPYQRHGKTLIREYDAKGNQMDERQVKRKERLQTLLPGSVVVVHYDEE